jgi:Tfp pilus assembly protein PilF
MSVVMVLAVTALFAQKNVRQSASNFLKDGKLDKAMEAINTCIQDPSTANDAKAWFIRGNVYLEISNSKDEKYKALDPDPITKALDSYKKAFEYDTKKEYFEDIFTKINWQRTNYFNAGVDAYNKKAYKDAMAAFENAANALAVMNVTDTTALFYAAACAGRANEKEKAKSYYIRLINGGSRDASVYMALSDVYRQEKDSVNALKTVKAGQKLYPNDLKLFLTETNIYLTFGNTSKALENLKLAIHKDSSNPTVYFAMGTIYDNISNDTTKSESVRKQLFNEAVSAYKNAIRLNPEYFEPNFNLGALYVNRASIINDKANKLPLDAEAEFKKLKVDADADLESALPYLEKASAINPADVNTLYSLKQIYARTNKMDKLKEVNAKIDAAGQKK